MFEEAAESLSAPKLPLRGPRSGIERLVPAPLLRSLPVVVLKGTVRLRARVAKCADEQPDAKLSRLPIPV